MVVGTTKARTGEKTDRAEADQASSGRNVSPLAAASLATGDEDKKHKRRKPAVKSREKLEEERALAFGVVYRTLLAPVTHLSPANGGRPYDPGLFAKFAKPAQEKVCCFCQGIGNM